MADAGGDEADPYFSGPRRIEVDLLHLDRVVPLTADSGLHAPVASKHADSTAASIASSSRLDTNERSFYYSGVRKGDITRQAILGGAFESFRREFAALGLTARESAGVNSAGLVSGWRGGAGPEAGAPPAVSGCVRMVRTRPRL